MGIDLVTSRWRIGNFKGCGHVEIGSVHGIVLPFAQITRCTLLRALCLVSKVEPAHTDLQTVFALPELLPSFSTVDYTYVEQCCGRTARVNNVFSGGGAPSRQTMTELHHGALTARLLLCGDIKQNPGPGPSRNTRQSKLTTTSGNLGLGEEGNVTDATNTDIMSAIGSMRGEVNQKFDVMANQIIEVNTKQEHLERQNEDLREQVGNLEEKLDELEGRSSRTNLIFHNIPEKEGNNET